MSFGVLFDEPCAEFSPFTWFSWPSPMIPSSLKFSKLLSFEFELAEPALNGDGSVQFVKKENKII